MESVIWLGLNEGSSLLLCVMGSWLALLAWDAEAFAAGGGEVDLLNFVVIANECLSRCSKIVGDPWLMHDGYQEYRFGSWAIGSAQLRQSRGV